MEEQRPHRMRMLSLLVICMTLLGSTLAFSSSLREAPATTASFCFGSCEPGTTSCQFLCVMTSCIGSTGCCLAQCSTCCESLSDLSNAKTASHPPVVVPFQG